jgi:hypothetical protein
MTDEQFNQVARLRGITVEEAKEEWHERVEALCDEMVAQGKLEFVGIASNGRKIYRGLRH